MKIKHDEQETWTISGILESGDSFRLVVTLPPGVTIEEAKRYFASEAFAQFLKSNRHKWEIVDDDDQDESK